jgi:hypothetical protein
MHYSRHEFLRLNLSVSSGRIFFSKAGGFGFHFSKAAFISGESAAGNKSASLQRFWV